MMYQITCQMIQIHERAIHHYIQQLEKTSFKHIQRKNWRGVRGSKIKSIKGTKCQVAFILPTRKTVSKKTLHEKRSSKHFGIMITASCLSHELGLYGVEKKFNGNSGILWKIDIVKMAHFTVLEKLKTLREWFLLWKCYLGTDWSEE